MANVDHPHGLTPVMSRMNDTPRMKHYYANVTTAIFRGDILQLQANGRVKTITTVAGVEAIIGVAAEYNAAATTPTVRIGVHDDPDTVYELQSDGTTDPATKAAAVAHIGQNANVVATTGVVASGQSAQELDYSDLGTSTTACMQVVGLYAQVGNDVTLAHARYLVQLNKHLHKGGLKGAI